MARKHHQLRAWQDAMELVAYVYAATANFPDSERFGVTAQMRRAAVSVPSNIAEGAARATRREFLRYLTMSRGSLSELDTQARIAERLGFLRAPVELLAHVDNVFGALGSLIRSQQKLSS